MRLLLSSLLLTVWTLPVWAQTNATEVRPMSLEDCVQVALQHNLDVQIKKYNPEISRFTLNVASAYYDPVFSMSGGHDYTVAPGGFDAQSRPYAGSESDVNFFNAAIQGLLPWGMSYNLGGSMNDTYGTRPFVVEDFNQPVVSTNSFVNINNNQPISFLTTNYLTINSRTPFETVAGQVGFLSLRQPLLKNSWIDNNRLQVVLDRKNLQISELDVRYQVMTTVTAVERAYYELVFAQQNVDVQRKALELAERQLAEDRKRIEVGTLAPLSEKQDQAQAAASRSDLLGALGTEDTQQRVLKDLLSDDYSKWKDVTIQPTAKLVAVPQQLNLRESWEKGLAQRPDLIQEKISLEKQGQIVRYQKNQLFPQLDLVGSYGLSGSSSELGTSLGQFSSRDNPFWSVGGQMSIPLSNKAARNNYRAAKTNKEQMGLILKQMEQRVLIQIEDAIAVVNTSFQRVQATREARIYAEAALDAEQKKLESGKSTSFEVLRLQRDLTNARSSEIRALADYNIALVQLSLYDASTLERRGITLDVK
jgi:outer membrane protein